MDIIIKYNTRASMKDLAKWRPSWMAGVGIQEPLNQTINFESLTKDLSFLGPSYQRLVQIKPIQSIFVSLFWY